MYIHSKNFISKLKFITQCVQKQAFPEFYKYVAIEYDESDNSFYIRSFDGQTHLRTMLGICEEESFVPPERGHPIACFDQSTILTAWSKVNDQIMISVDYKKRIMLIKSSRAKSSEVLVSANAYTDFPDYGKYKEIPMPADFAKCIDRVSWAADEKSVDVRCRGIFLKNDDSHLELMSTDRAVIAIAKSYDNTGIINFEGIISKKSALIMKDIMSAKSDCEISSNETGLSIVNEENEIATAFYDENALAYDSVVKHALETSEMASVRVGRVHLIEAGSFISPFCELEKMKLTFKNNVMYVRAEIQSKGKKGLQEVEYISDSEDVLEVELVMQTKRLLDPIGSFDSDEVRLEFAQVNPKQIIIHPESSDDSVETLVLATLLSPDSAYSSEPKAKSQKRQKKNNSNHRDQ